MLRGRKSNCLLGRLGRAKDLSDAPQGAFFFRLGRVRSSTKDGIWTDDSEVGYALLYVPEGEGATATEESWRKRGFWKAVVWWSILCILFLSMRLSFNSTNVLISFLLLSIRTAVYSSAGRNLYVLA
ncbi:MAG: hypothetical protein DRN28_02040 [Thermoplasmata archaeon]|nr:MAG: hypothetical protein DRN28_02040 [Thermoplasmata archaeon]